MAALVPVTSSVCSIIGTSSPLSGIIHQLPGGDQHAGVALPVARARPSAWAL